MKNSSVHEARQAPRKKAKLPRPDKDDARTVVSPPGERPAPASVAAPGISLLRHVLFGYFNPEAREVYIVGSFNSWDRRAAPMTRDNFGSWSINVDLPPGEYRYRLLVDGEWRDDPCAQVTAANPFGGFDAIKVVV